MNMLQTALTRQYGQQEIASFQESTASAEPAMEQACGMEEACEDDLTNLRATAQCHPAIEEGIAFLRKPLFRSQDHRPKLAVDPPAVAVDGIAVESVDPAPVRLRAGGRAHDPDAAHAPVVGVVQMTVQN
jgi:hypothetical protein